MTKRVIDLNIEKKIYRKRSTKVTILRDFSLTVSQGEKLAIIGESGVGKSSLLNVLGLIDKQFDGSYRLFDEDVATLPDGTLAQWRNSRVGFVLQESALIPSLNIEDNIKLPLLYTHAHPSDLPVPFYELTDSLGIASILKKKPLECSGGEKARAVFALGIIMSPDLILADEPTASLDAENKTRIMDLLLDFNVRFGSTIITVTHDLEVARQHDRVIELKKDV